MDFNTEKSRMRKVQTDEMKQLEKEKKKKKSQVQKDEIQVKIKECEERHSKELNELYVLHGVEELKVHKEDHSNPTGNKKIGEVFTDRQWSTLGRKELEEECKKRGVGKHGKKEDLVTRLTIFTQERKSSPTMAISGATPQKSSGEVEDIDDVSDDEVEEELNAVPLNSGGAAGAAAGEAGGGASAGAAGRGRGSGRKVNTDGIPEPSHSGRKPRSWGRKFNKRGRGAGSRLNKDVDSDSEVKSRNMGWQRPRNRGGDESSDDEENEQHSGDENGKSKDAGSKKVDRDQESADEEAEQLAYAEETAKQKKRGKVMLSVLKEVLKRNPKGVKIDNLKDEFEKLKVQNFTPQLLGFSSVEEWLRGQPLEILYYDVAKSRLMPPDAISDSEDEE